MRALADVADDLDARATMLTVAQTERGPAAGEKLGRLMDGLFHQASQTESAPRH
jgi:hypothetical protein